MRVSTFFALATRAVALPNRLAATPPGVRGFPITELGVRSELEIRQYSQDTYNQLTDGTPCRSVTVIYARGTTQAGNVGDAAAVGPVFFDALAALLGEANLAIQGVDYPADIIGFLEGGDQTGSKLMASLVSTVSTSLPHTWPL